MKTYFNANKFMAVNNIYTYNTVVETFKILKLNQPISMYTEFFSLSNISDYRLNVPKGRLLSFSSSFYYKSPTLWNTFLTLNLVKNINLVSLSYLKRHLKLFLFSMQKEFDENTWHDYNTNFIDYVKFKNRS